MTKLICPLFTMAGDSPDSIALKAGSRTLTYRQFYSLVARMAIGLSEQGIGPGHRVAVCLDNSIEYLALIVAMLRRGGITCPLSTRLPLAGIDAALENLQIPTLITSPRLVSTIKTVATLTPDALIANVGKEHHSTAASAELSPDQPATIIMTSGSSATPKAALHSFGNHYYNALGANERIPFGPGDRWLLSLPLYHVGGLAILFRAVLGGGTVVLADPTLDLAAQIARDNITHLSVISTQLRRLLRDLSDSNLRSLKAILLGGGPIISSLVEEGLAAGLPIATTYGLTEMASQATTSQPDDSGILPKSSGSLLNYREMKVDESGEILVRGRCLFLGYVTEDTVRPMVDHDGWFHTGDRGCFDEHHNLIVTGRIDNMFISGGENIQPEDIEAALCRLDGVLEAVVVGVADEEYGHRPVAFVQIDQATSIDPTDLSTRLKKSLPKFKIPMRFFPWPTETGSGRLKPDRIALSALADKILAEES